MKKIIFLALIPFFIYADFQENLEQFHTIQDDNSSQHLFTKAPTPTKPTDAPINPGNIIKTMVITKPIIIDSNNREFDGISTFTFPCNIIYKPDPNYSTPFIYNNYTGAFIINKDNMTIDFNGYNLSFDAPSTSNFMINNQTYGIAIYQGVKNLKIISSSPNGSSQPTHQGSITNFTGYAIFGSGSTQSYNSYDIYSLRIKNLLIDNLLITQNKNGIYLENAFNPTITNTNVIYNYSPQILYGIYFSNILNGLIDACNINQNWSYIDVYGIYLEDTTSLTVQNCQANSNMSLKSGNATGIKLTGSAFLTASSDNFINNCIMNRNLCANFIGKSSIGLHVYQSERNVIQYCTSLNSGHTQTPAGLIPPTITPEGIGIKFQASNLNTVKNNTVGFHPNYGLQDTAAVSSCYFISNTSMYCNINYDITVPDKTSGSSALKVINLYSNDTDSALGAGPLYANYSIQATE